MSTSNAARACLVATLLAGFVAQAGACVGRAGRQHRHPRALIGGPGADRFVAMAVGDVEPSLDACRFAATPGLRPLPRVVPHACARRVVSPRRSRRDPRG